jgi:hypothetical protein
VSVYGDAPDNADEATEDADSQEGATSSAKSIRIRRALRKRQRGKSTMFITRPLTPGIVAEGRLDVRNHRASANRLW